MDKDFIEAILIWKESANEAEVVEWLHSRNLSTIKMSAGLLITGSREAYQSAFAVDLGDKTTPLSLPIPEGIKEHVASIQIPQLRQIHDPILKK